MELPACNGICCGNRPGYKKYGGMCQLCYVYEEWRKRGTQFRHEPSKRFPHGRWRISPRAKWRPMETYSAKFFLPR